MIKLKMSLFQMQINTLKKKKRITASVNFVFCRTPQLPWLSPVDFATLSIISSEKILKTSPGLPNSYHQEEQN